MKSGGSLLTVGAMVLPSDIDGSWPSAVAHCEMPRDALEIGRILDAWGLKGWLRIQPFSEDAPALLRAKHWYLAPPDNERSARLPGVARQWPASLEVVSSRMHGDTVVAQVRGVDDRTAAEVLRGGRLFVSRAVFPKTGPDEFYWVDLIGMTVVNRDGHRFGEVLGLMSTGPQSVLRVKPEMAPTKAGSDSDADHVGAGEATVADERLIPFVDAYVDRVDMATRTITVDWGLDY